MKKFIVVFILSSLFYSCATLPSLNIPQSFNPNSEKGMVVGSIAIKNEEPIFNSYMFYYIGGGTKEITANKMIKINPEQTVTMKFKPDFFDGDKAVYYFSIQENEGEYLFSHFRLFENGGFMHRIGDMPFEINFKIEKGKVKYLGEIYVDVNQSLIQLNNQRERDLQKLSEKYPNLKIE